LLFAIDDVITVVLVDASSHDEDTGCSVELRTVDCRLQVRTAAVQKAMNHNTGCLNRLEDFIAVDGRCGVNLRAVETKIRQELELISNRQILLDHLKLDGLPDPRSRL